MSASAGRYSSNHCKHRASVVRTLTSSTTSVIYTAADQTTDFGAPVPEVTVRVYQLSAIVGRGTPAEATI